jgi:hypothetical protein
MNDALGRECTERLLKFSLSLNSDSNWQRSWQQEIWIKCPYTGIQCQVYIAHTQRGWYSVFSCMNLFPQHVHLAKNYTFHYNSRRWSDSGGCNHCIWGPFPSHDPHEIYICHWTPVIHCYTQTHRCAVHTTTGYIKLTTKCDISRGESYESLPKTIIYNYIRSYKNMWFWFP